MSNLTDYLDKRIRTFDDLADELAEITKHMVDQVPDDIKVIFERNPDFIRNVIIWGVWYDSFYESSDAGKIYGYRTVKGFGRRIRKLNKIWEGALRVEVDDHDEGRIRVTISLVHNYSERDPALRTQVIRTNLMGNTGRAQS